MRKFLLYTFAGLMLATAFLTEGCGRGTVRRRTVWFGDHSVTVTKRHGPPRVHGGVKRNYSNPGAVRTPGR